MILSYPTISPTLTININDPNLGDTTTIETQVINRESRSGEIITYNDTDWPINKIRSFTFSALTKTKRDSLENFFITTAGLEIAILDHINDIWFGYIVSEINEIITVRDNCSYDASFEFLGRKI